MGHEFFQPVMSDLEKTFPFESKCRFGPSLNNERNNVFQPDSELSMSTKTTAVPLTVVQETFRHVYVQSCVRFLLAVGCKNIVTFSSPPVTNSVEMG